MADALLLASTRVVPRVARESGFEFSAADLEAACRVEQQMHRTRREIAMTEGTLNERADSRSPRTPPET